MITVNENPDGLKLSVGISDMTSFRRDYEESKKKQLRFYDFVSKESSIFTGYSDEPDSVFVNEIEQMYQQYK